MMILALDSATSACSAALWQDGNVLAHHFAAMQRGQSEHLVPIIARCMQQGGADFADLDAIAVTVGPGAFTGIRIGLATARGLGLACGKPVLGLSTTQCVAAAVPPALRQQQPVLAVLDSRRDELWVQAFGPDLAPLGGIQALTPSGVAQVFSGPYWLVGDGAARVAPLCPQARLLPDIAAPDARWLAEQAALCRLRGDCLPPEPLYLRDADVTLPKGCG